MPELRSRRRKLVLNGPVELPAFASEAEEAWYWPSVEFSEDYLRNGPSVLEGDSPRARPRVGAAGAMEGAGLRGRRKRLGLTQAELGEVLGIPRATISRWELGLLPIEHGKLLRLVLDRLAGPAIE